MSVREQITTTCDDDPQGYEIADFEIFIPHDLEEPIDKVAASLPEDDLSEVINAS